MSTNNVNIGLALSIPGEQLIIKALDVWSRGRDNMNPAIRDKWDEAGFTLFDTTIGFLLRQLKKAEKNPE